MRIKMFGVLSIMVFCLGLIPYQAQAWGNAHYHGGGYYGPGWGGGYWGGPNVVINVPVAPPIITVPVVPPRAYYVPDCERVRICDNYTGDCWLERYCTG